MCINIGINELKATTNFVYLSNNKSIRMSYLGVQDRFQIQMRSMEEFIDNENSLCFVDAFVEQLELDNSGFEIATLKKITYV